MKRLRNLLVVAVAFVAIAGLAGCASVPRNDALVGTWNGGDKGAIVLNADGSALFAGHQFTWGATDTVLTMYNDMPFIGKTEAYTGPYELNGDTLTFNGMEYTKTK